MADREYDRFAVDTATLHQIGMADEHCLVDGSIEEGESAYRLTLGLPSGWNGRLLGIGNNGLGGAVDMVTLAWGVRRGFATAGTDSGHTGDNMDASFILVRPGSVSKDSVADFAHRSTHRMTNAAKQIIGVYYGRPPSRSYFYGCSTGGRQGFKEVQKYPQDYDGVVSGAPAFDPQTIYFEQLWRVHALYSAASRRLEPEDLRLVHAAVLKACDGMDGLADGILSDPMSCRWRPGALLCGNPGAEACLSPEKVRAIEEIYDGPRATGATGGSFSGLPRGSELEWQHWLLPFSRSLPQPVANVLSRPALRSLGLRLFPGVYGRSGELAISAARYGVFLDPGWDPFSLQFDRAFDDFHESPVLAEMAATEPDVSGFVERGGKWLIYHGWNDSAYPPFGLARYFEDLQAHMEEAEIPIADNVRLFLLPGVAHCGGGVGAYHFDPLSMIQTWVENGQPPDGLTARNPESGLTRPLCRYPAVARYSGEGDPNKASSFSCK